ncbi:hypothetical protein HDU76_002682 [Blyttiomyces sp. JEL0837]|nr:hypothetical protein HDU76_002682 [Blyttiomyces sp. JEL0837]
MEPEPRSSFENHLRLHGSYDLWTNELVMERARLKRLDSAVVEILRNYRIDGPLLATLDDHWLKEKCNVPDSSLRAQFMQEVEFLKDSHQFIANSNANGGSLPQYEGTAENHG